MHKDKVGSVGGAMHGLANISGIIGPLVTGFIVQFSGKYDYAFYLAGAIASFQVCWYSFLLKIKD